MISSGAQNCSIRCVYSSVPTRRNTIELKAAQSQGPNIMTGTCHWNGSLLAQALAQQILACEKMALQGAHTRCNHLPRIGNSWVSSAKVSAMQPSISLTNPLACMSVATPRKVPKPHCQLHSSCCSGGPGGRLRVVRSHKSLGKLRDRASSSAAIHGLAIIACLFSRHTQGLAKEAGATQRDSRP